MRKERNPSLQKNLVDEKTLQLLCELAREVGLEDGTNADCT